MIPPRGLLAAIVALLAACSSTPGPTALPDPTADGAGVATAPATVAPTPTPGPTDGETGGDDVQDPDVAPPRPPSGSAREPTGGDAAAYLAAVEPDGVERLLGVAVDVDDDGAREVVLHGIRDGLAWVGVAAWDGFSYRLVTQAEAGPASRTEDLRVADVNADGVSEVVLSATGDAGTSLVLWAAPAPGVLVPLRAVGGCADGSHVFGVLGATLVEVDGGALDVVATCDDSPLPVADWSSQRWRWSGGAYRLVPGQDDSVLDGDSGGEGVEGVETAGDGTSEAEG